MIVSAMDIGGTHVTVANVDVENRTVVPGEVFRMPLDSAAGADEIVAALAGCAARLPGANRWAIALPGPFDYERGIGQYQGMGKFEALRGYDLRAALTPLLPGAVDVSFHHDADAFLIGEWWAGAARGHRTAVGITLGTGVGSSFLRDGHILRHGPGIPPDGRADLLRHEGKPLEETVSRRAIRRAYRQATDGSPDVREIAWRARRGDRAAADAITQAFRALGEALRPCLEAFEPTIVVVGGSMAASWDLVAGPLRAGLGRTVPLEPALHPAAAPLLGAAHLAASPCTTDERSPL